MNRVVKKVGDKEFDVSHTQGELAYQRANIIRQKRRNVLIGIGTRLAFFLIVIVALFLV